VRATLRPSFLGITQTDAFALSLVALLVVAVLIASWALYHTIDRGLPASGPLDNEASIHAPARR
jgi:hypothetical protein